MAETNMGSNDSKYGKELSPKERALFDLLLKEKRSLNSQRLKIPRRQPANSYPLSFTQQRLWILDQLASDRASYNIYFTAHLKGQLDVDALQRSLDEIVCRHEILRTTFQVVDGQPAQMIVPRASLPLARKELSHLCSSERQRLIQLCIDEQIRQPFDLSECPLIRVAILKNGEEDHIIVVVVHHIAFDGWSISVFVRELTLLYEAFSAGRPSPLAELPIQYADFSVWQRTWLRGRLLEEQLAYWKRQLRGADQVLELPTDHEARDEGTSHGAFRPFLLGSELSESLKHLSRQEGVTLFMTLLAAFHILLHRYSGQEEIFVGSPVAYRNWTETENLIGCFINTLVLRGDTSGNPTFKDFLASVRQVAQEAYAHQDLPFDLIVDALQPERSSTRSPLFRVWFVLQNTQTPLLRLPDLSIKHLPVYEGGIKFDLALLMIDSTQGIEGWWHYNRDLFEAATIEEMGGHFTTLLEQVVADPELRLLDIPLYNPGPGGSFHSAPGFESFDNIEDHFQPNLHLPSLKL
jgi:Condensation domain